MRGRYLLVVVVAVLALSAQPVAAQNASAVASKHSTFGTGAGEPSPTTLDNVEIVGSGPSASLAAGTTTAYNPAYDDGDGSPGDSVLFLGDDGVDRTLSAEIRLQPKSDGQIESISPYIAGAVGSDYGARVDIYIVEEQPDGTYGEGQLVRSDWDPDWSTGRQQIDISAFDVAAGQDYTIEFITDSTDNDATRDALDIRADFGSSGQWYSLNAFSRTGYYADLDAEINRSLTGAQYISATHEAESVTSGWTNLTLQNADATVTWQEDGDDDGTWTNVTSTTYSASGNVTADLSATTSDRWRVRIDFEKTGSNAVAELHDEGILFASSGPTLSDPEPPDRVKIANATGEVSIKVSDADFPLAQSDSVTVSATDDDGNSLGSTTLTSNSTASFSYSSDAGENTIQWTATDEYGNTNTFTQTYTTPENLYIRPESDPDALVSGPNVSIQVRFYASDSVYTRTTSDGVVNLAGLPADARFAVVVSADGYYRRRVIIDSLFEQQSIYLLNESKPAVEKQFVLNDVSGNFPAQSTRLYVQRPINNSATYKTVAADYFGATSAFSTFLQTDQRYRLIVENDQGDRRTLGSYTPVAAGVETLKIEGVSLYRESQAGIIANASTRRINNGTQRQVVVRYRDPAAATSSYTVEIYERGNESNVTYSEQVTGPVQNYSAYVDVENSTNYVVNWSATRGGQQISGVRPVGGGDLGLRIPLPAQWLGTIGLTILVFVGSLAGERYATHLALAVVAFAGVLMYLAVVDIFLPLWWAGLLIAAGGHLAQRRPAA
jgi:hypothetical protein